MVDADIDVEFRGVRKFYGANEVIASVFLSVRRGELLTLLGPSGCGKTTLLRLLAGFIRPSEGEIWLGGKRIDHVIPSKRNIGMVFQGFALFPHMTIHDNIAFGLHMRRLDKQTVEKRVMDVLDLVHLVEWKNAYPSQLSGGMQQRVALARVLAIQPRVLLMDEPFGAIDRLLRDEMQIEVRKLQRILGITTLFVTHDQQEALIVSDRIIVMNQGKVEQEGTPVEIYDRPKTLFVARFLGKPNLIQARMCSIGEGCAIVEFGNNLRMAVPIDSKLNAVDITLAIRPEHIGLSTASSKPLQRESGNHNTIGSPSFALCADGVINFSANLGSRVSYEIKLNEGPLLVAETQRADRSSMYNIGEPVIVELKGEYCSIFEK